MTAAHRRLHLVLIPGFAGFDALGQLEYYAGVTPLFRRWQQQSGARAALHYFDNFPTASVATRAQRLQQYLAKRVARGEFGPGDTVSLIGHSTGGLDIRRLLWNLAAATDQHLSVDGGEDVRAADIRERIRSVVFLSVPQWGTNIAWWVRTNMLARAVVVAQLRASVAAAQAPLLCRLQNLIGASTAEFANLDLFRAVHDALQQAAAGAALDATQTAAAHEAASHLELWLRHMVWDFAAIDDLTPAAAPERITERTSPAHFPAALRQTEVAGWGSIRTRSYATVSPRAFRFEPGQPGPPWEISSVWTWPAFTPGAQAERTDIAYRYCYRACAGGPFAVPASQQVPALTPWGKAEPLRIELWDSDGIVNTASMLWPNGRDTVLVEGDHMDIVGHYHRDGMGAYDLLGSASGFDASACARVWNSVFDFCASRTAPSAAGGM